MRHRHFQLVLLLILSTFSAGVSWGEEFCVDSAESLQTALNNASSNGNDDTIMVGTWDSASGNIGGNPLFVGAGDYHLQPVSPCRDAGTASAPELPATDIDGENRTQGAAPDIGADEYGIGICVPLLLLLDD